MMSKLLPNQIKRIIKKLPFRFTKNQHYDYWTKQIISQHLKPNSNCVDIGCFEGEILDLLIETAPHGKHYAFEPIPEKFDALKLKYKDQVNVDLNNFALSNKIGRASFNWVTSNPSYSGLLKRDYDHPNEKDCTIQVNTTTLDQSIPENTAIDLIKIDVEGAEFLVLKGAINTITKNKPLVVFEHGLGGSDKYGTSPEMLFEFFQNVDMKISLLNVFLNKSQALNKEAFTSQYYNRKNYYFIAHN